MESHQPFEENDVGRISVSRVGKTLMLDEGILRDRDSIVAFLHLFEYFVSEVEVQGVGMVEIVFGSIGVLSET